MDMRRLHVYLGAEEGCRGRALCGVEARGQCAPPPEPGAGIDAGSGAGLIECNGEAASYARAHSGLPGGIVPAASRMRSVLRVN